MTQVDPKDEREAAQRRYEEEQEQEAIDSLPTNFVECRSIGHAWSIRWWGNVRELADELIPEVVRAFRFDLVRVSRCLRCTTVRDEFMPKGSDFSAARFQTQYRRYRYPDGYSIKDHGYIRRAQFSRTAYERWKVGDDFLGANEL